MASWVWHDSFSTAFWKKPVYTYEHPLSWLSPVPASSRSTSCPTSLLPWLVFFFFFNMSAREIFLNCISAYCYTLLIKGIQGSWSLSRWAPVPWLSSEGSSWLMVPWIYHMPPSLPTILEDFGFFVSYKFFPRNCSIVSVWNPSSHFFVLPISTHPSVFLCFCLLVGAGRGGRRKVCSRVKQGELVAHA